MATSRRVRDNRINSSRSARSYSETYTNGNAVRYVEAVPERRTRGRQTRREEQIVINKERNRENALRVNASYVLFMICICVVLIVVSVNYLKLQAAGTAFRNEIAARESELSELKLANDNSYEHMMASIDMESVKKIAINELGMRYADEGQIITYNSQHGDYIRQYGEITTGN